METPNDVTWEDVFAYCKMGGIGWAVCYQLGAVLVKHPVTNATYYCDEENPAGAIKFLAGDGK